MPPPRATVDPTVKLLARLGRALNWLEESLLAALLAAMTLLTFAQVVARYVFNSGWVWVLELSIFLFAWLVLIGAAYGVRVHAHIGVDLLLRVLPPPLRKACAGLALLLALLYAVLLFKGGWDTVALLHLIQIEAEDLPVPRWIPTLALPLGFALLGLRLLEAGWALLRGRGDGLLLADEAAEAVAQLRSAEDGK